MTRLKRPLLVVLLFLCFFAGRAAAAGPSEVDVLYARGIVNPVLANYISAGIQQAQSNQATVCIIQLNTPGGLDTSMRDIVQSITNATVPVVVYVSPAGARAASAGVFVTLAAHVAVMAPDTNIGAAHPVSLDSSGSIQQLPSDISEKILNDSVAYIKSITAGRGRNVTWAEDAVRKSISATSTEALQMNIIDLIAPDIPSLLSQLEGRQVTLLNGNSVTIHTREATIHDIPMNFFQSILFTVSDPTVAYVLLIIGILGVLLEFFHPGAVIPGSLGGILLFLAIYSLSAMPVNIAGISLIILSFILFAADIMTPGLGLLTAGGIASLVAGSLILFGGGSEIYKVDIRAVTAVIIVVIVAVILIIRAVVRGQLRKPVSGAEALVGATAIVYAPLIPRGTVFLEGEIWNATLPEGEQAEAGEEVIITKVDGLKLTVVRKK